MIVTSPANALLTEIFDGTIMNLNKRSSNTTAKDKRPTTFRVERLNCAHEALKNFISEVTVIYKGISIKPSNKSWKFIDIVTLATVTSF